jgi:hypothetical protein
VFPISYGFSGFGSKDCLLSLPFFIPCLALTITIHRDGDPPIATVTDFFESDHNFPSQNEISWNQFFDDVDNKV